MENMSSDEHLRAAKSPKERLDGILAGYAALVEAYNAGDPDVVAQVAAAGRPEANARAKEAYADAVEAR